MLFSGENLRKLIIPLLLEQALVICVGMADTMMVSSVGEAAISGVSLVDMVNNLIISILAALATGGSVVTSQYLGAGKRDKACASARQLIVSAGVISVIVTVVCILLKTPLLRLFFGSIDQDVMDSAIIYLVISALSFPFLAVYQCCAALFRAMGNSKVTFQVSLIMNGINIAGNALCIFWPSHGCGGCGCAIPGFQGCGRCSLVHSGEKSE